MRPLHLAAGPLLLALVSIGAATGATGPEPTDAGILVVLPDNEASLGGFLWSPAGSIHAFLPEGGDASFVVRDRRDPALAHVRLGPGGDGLAFLIDDGAEPAYAIVGRGAESAVLRPLRIEPAIRLTGRSPDGSLRVDVAPPWRSVNCVDGSDRAHEKGPCEGDTMLQAWNTDLRLRTDGGTERPLPGCENGCRDLRLPARGELCWTGEIRVMPAAGARCEGGNVSGFACGDEVAAATCRRLGGRCRAQREVGAVGPGIPGACTSLETLTAVSGPGPSCSGPACGDLRLQAGTVSASTHAGGTPEVEVSGECPGKLRIDVQRATPGAGLALALVGRTSDLTCDEEDLGLRAGSGLLSLRAADGAGNLQIHRSAPSAWCGRDLQVLDLASCNTAPVRALPSTY